MTRTEWTARCAARLVAGGLSPAWAQLDAEACAAEQAELHGVSGAAWERPDHAADEALLADEEDQAC